jgi:pimeloyl-ACP methyl ester carboxylesterase
MLHVVNDGFQIAYEVSGRGLSTGFLFPQTRVGWDKMGYVDALNARAKVVIADPRGFGESTRARHERAYSLDAMCDDLLAAADAAGVREFVACGYSNTAALAIALALKSERVVGLLCAGMDPLLDFTATTAHITAEAESAGEGQYASGGSFDWRAVRALYDDYIALQTRFPDTFDIPAVLVFGSDDALVAPSVATNRARLETMGFSVATADGYDHESLVDAADVVLRLAASVLTL